MPILRYPTLCPRRKALRGCRNHFSDGAGGDSGDDDK